MRLFRGFKLAIIGFFSTGVLAFLQGCNFEETAKASAILLPFSCNANLSDKIVWECSPTPIDDEVCIINFDGTGFRQLTKNSYPDSDPAMAGNHSD